MRHYSQPPGVVPYASQERTNVLRTEFFLHTPDISLSKVTALKVVWGKDTSRRSKEPWSDLPSCFSAWAPFCKCGWRHHISRSGCGPDCKWLEYILPISSVVVKVECLRKEGKTVTPSRKLQANGEIACMTTACLLLSSFLVIRWLRARRLPFRQAIY